MFFLCVCFPLLQEMNLGRSWRFRPMGSGECYVSSPVLRKIGISPNMGQRVNLNLNLGGLAVRSLIE